MCNLNFMRNTRNDTLGNIAATHFENDSERKLNSEHKILLTIHIK